MSGNRAYIGHICTLLTVLIYSYNVNIVKLLMPKYIDSFGLVLMRGIVTFISFWVVSLIFPDKGFKISRSDMKKIIFLGLIGYSAQLLLYYKGISMTGPIDSVVLRSLVPIMVILILVLFFKKKAHFREVIGVILGIIGVIYITVTPHTAGATDSLIGDLLILASTALVAVYNIKVVDLVEKIPTFTLMKWLSFYGLLLSFPIGAKDLFNAPFIGMSVESEIIWHLIVSCFLVGVVTNYLVIVALKYISAFVRSAYFYFLPITGTIVAIMLNIQRPTIHDAIAFIIIVAGFVLINYDKSTLIIRKRK